MAEKKNQKPIELKETLKSYALPVAPKGAPRPISAEVKQPPVKKSTK